MIIFTGSNVSTRSGDLGERVESVTVVDFDGNLSTLSRNEITFGFRSSSLDDVVILSVTLKLDKEDSAELSKRMQKFWILRKNLQPTGELASACAFKNPHSGVLARDLIDKAGLKGTKIGCAQVSERCADFIVVTPEATIDDVHRLMDLVKEQVAKRTEIELEAVIECW